MILGSVVDSLKRKHKNTVSSEQEEILKNGP